MALLKCSNCGALVDDSNNYCPQCGAPLYDQTKKKQRKSVWGVILALLMVVLLIGGFFVKREIDSYNYAENMRNVYLEMMTSAADAENAGNLIHSVWYNSIFEIDDAETNKYTRQSGGEGPFFSDFNDALSLLMEDYSFQLNMASLSASQFHVAQLMKELNDPPKKYSEDYTSLKKLYGAYNELLTIVLNPSGSLQSFTENYNEADENLADYAFPLMYLAS